MRAWVGIRLLTKGSLGLPCELPARGMPVFNWELVAVLGTPPLSPLLPSAPLGASCLRAPSLILPWALPALSLPDVSSLDTVLKLLKDAFNCISHCPPSTLHSQLCQLLALATGSRDPLSTAYLLSESLSITTRHQLLDVIHRKIQ